MGTGDGLFFHHQQQQGLNHWKADIAINEACPQAV